MENIIIAMITGGFSVLCIVLSNIQNNRKIEQQLDKSQAVMNCKIEELTREVREHNGFAKRMPVVEEQIKVINHRLQI